MADIIFHKIESRRDGEPDYAFFCPGCQCDHGIWTTKHNAHKARWKFNGSQTKPTVSPSIKVSWYHTDNGKNRKDFICHSFVKNGKIQFLNDCTHRLAGQTVDLPPYDHPLPDQAPLREIIEPADTRELLQLLFTLNRSVISNPQSP